MMVVGAPSRLVVPLFRFCCLRRRTEAMARKQKMIPKLMLMLMSVMVSRLIFRTAGGRETPPAVGAAEAEAGAEAGADADSE